MQTHPQVNPMKYSIFLFYIITSFSMAPSMTHAFEKGSQQTFLEAIQEENHFYDFEQIMDKVGDHRWHKGHYLSLGESHLHKKTSRPVLLKFAYKFLKDTPFKKKFCTENIPDFLTSYPGREMQRLSQEVTVFGGNSPYLTNFKTCSQTKSDLILTYSGFFHQHPFARYFPLDFAQTPVLTKPGNNIMEQMPNKKGLFITLMELDHLELTTSQAMIKKKIRDPQKFKDEVLKLSEKVSVLRSKMRPLWFRSSSWRTKEALILDQIHFQNIKVLPHNTFILLTDLSSRKILPPLKLLQDLVALPENVLSKFLDFIAEERSFITSSLQEPDDQGQYHPTGYGTYSLRFPGGSTFLDLIDSVNKKSILLVSSPKAKELKCYTQSEGQTIELNCHELF